MRVIVNRLVALGVKTGVGHYTAELVRCLPRHDDGDSIDRYPAGLVSQTARLYSRLRPLWQRKDTSPRAGPQPKPNRHRWLRLDLHRRGLNLLGEHFRRQCAREGYDLYHEPNFIPLPADCPTIVTLHDLSVLLHPEWHPADRVAQYERHFPAVLQRSVHFLTVSEFVRQEVIRKLGVPSQRVTRVYNGIRPKLARLPADVVAARLQALNLPSQYLLYVGTIEPRKNILTLLKAYCALSESLRREWPLLLVGSWGWNAREVADYLDSTARARGVRQLGYVADRDLPVIYNGARALIYPSCYEGFGLPPLEMMACGGAVLASTAGAVIETVGSRAHLIHPDDLDGWRRGLERVVRDDDWCAALRAGVEEVARPYTWERCAAETLGVYRRVCGQRRRHEQPPSQFRAA